MRYDFNERLKFSLGRQQASDMETIRDMIPGCVSVTKTGEAADRKGIDYVAVLRGGAEVFIDAKNRDAGCSKYWQASEPELALEIWSVKPGGRYRTRVDDQKAGWTLSERSNVDLILFKFPPADTETVYLMSFQLLRAAFRANFRDWTSRFKKGVQDSGSWESEALFVPAFLVFDAINRISVSALRDPNQALLIA